MTQHLCFKSHLDGGIDPKLTQCGLDVDTRLYRVVESNDEPLDQPNVWPHASNAQMRLGAAATFTFCPECIRNRALADDEATRREDAQRVLERVSALTQARRRRGQGAAQGADAVNHPTHYNQGKFEVIDVIDDWKLNFSLGNAVKYIARAPFKGKQLEDLKKARFYLDYEIAKREAEDGNQS